MRRRKLWLGVTLGLACGLQAKAEPLPTVSIHRTPEGSIRLSWPFSPAGYALERSDTLTAAPSVWQAVAKRPFSEGNQASVALDPPANQFFQLRATPPVSILETSPSANENGVAPTRETVIRFTGPLAANSGINTNQLFATIGGQRLDSRVRLSSDARSVTLYYAQPLPIHSQVSVTFDSAGLFDFWNRPLDGDGDGMPGGTATFLFETAWVTPFQGSRVVGRIFAAEQFTASTNSRTVVNRPLEGVTVTVLGSEPLLQTATDAFGNFTLDPGPAGQFFVLIDGRTAADSQWPDGAFYPPFQTTWRSFAQRENWAGETGEVYLPLIAPSGLANVDGQSIGIGLSTDILQTNSFPEGVGITVVANSTFTEPGASESRVGVELAAPNRLPRSLPHGLEPAIVLSVPTDRPAQFDPPAAIRFPNLPDPFTGERLRVNEKSSLWGYDPDIGRWGIVGAGVVTSAGELIESDLDTGVDQTGWFFPGPVTYSEDCNCDGWEVEAAIAVYEHALKRAVSQVLSSGAVPVSSPALSSAGTAADVTPSRIVSRPAIAPLGAPSQHLDLYHLVLNVDLPADIPGYPNSQVRARLWNAQGEGLFLSTTTRYRIWTAIPQLRWAFFTDFTTSSIGSKMRIPVPAAFAAVPPTVVDGSPDADGDGLPNDSEFIIGTQLNQQDSDGDGTQDGLEAVQGNDPRPPPAQPTGLLSLIETAGPAIDLWASNDFIAVAEGAQGVSIFNSVAGLTPLRIAQVPTPGPAQAISGSGELLAVAAGEAGVILIDATKPANPQVRAHIQTDRAAQAVATGAQIAYVGLASGVVLAVDMTSGTVLRRAQLPAPIYDLAVKQRVLYALTRRTLYVLPLMEQSLSPSAAVEISGVPTISAGDVRPRVALGDGRAFVSHPGGFHIFDLSNPFQPTLVTATADAAGIWNHFVPAGSGFALAAVTRREAPNGPSEIRLYGFATGSSEPLRTTFMTAGPGRALALANGAAYVADGESGLKAFRYLGQPPAGPPPAARLITDIRSNVPEIEEGQPFLATVFAANQQPLRKVEFYLGGRKVATDSTPPFETAIISPILTEGNASFPVHARAIDSYGNAVSSPDLTIRLRPDDTPPQLLVVTPADGQAFGRDSLRAITASFSEPIDEIAANDGRFQLFASGPDGRIGTPDDLPVSGGVLSYRPEAQSLFLSFASPLPPERYQAVVRSGITDLSGNVMVEEVIWGFSVFVSDAAQGSSGPVSGRLAHGQVVDSYTLTGAPGEIVYFDAQSGDNCESELYWRLTDPSGTTVFNQVFATSNGCGSRDPGSYVLKTGGDYTLTVYSPAGVAEEYHFQVWPVLHQSFPMRIGEVVAEGTPGPGAGSIESPGARDIYTFNAEAEQTIFFEAQSGSNCDTALRWRCVDPSGAVLFDQVLATIGECGPRDPGSFRLARAGLYTIIVYGVEEGTGTYQFQVSPIQGGNGASLIR